MLKEIILYLYFNNRQIHSQKRGEIIMPRKGENIYKRKDGRWEGRYIKSRTPSGKTNYGYVYAKTYREVKAKLIYKSSTQVNTATVSPEVSSDLFEYIATEWFDSISPQVKEATSNKY